MLARRFLLGNGTNQTIFASDFEEAKQTVLAGLDELQAKLAEGQNLVGQGLENIISGGADGAAAWV